MVRSVCRVALTLTRPTMFEDLRMPGKRSRHPALSYQTQILLGVTTAGNGTSHFSTGNASTPWQSCA